MKISKLRLSFALAFTLAFTLAPLSTPVQAAPAPTYTSKTDGFAIYLPGKPTLSSRPMAMPGMAASTVNFVSVKTGSVAYVVIPMKLPGTPKGATINQFLDGAERGFTMSASAKLISSKKISLPGAPGREIVLQAGPNLMRGRFYVKGNHSYQIIAVSPKSAGAKYNAQISQVMNSFRILK